MEWVSFILTIVRLVYTNIFHKIMFSGNDENTATLPLGWEEREDGANGRTYYVNLLAQITQWQHPGNDRHLEDDIHLEVEAREPVVKYKNLNTEGLPEGWTMQVAPNGRVFFINHNDKKTTWVDPRTGRPSPLPLSPTLQSPVV